jgi:hypothetical protein
LRRNIRVLFVAGTLTCAVALLNPLAKADPGLTLHPRGFGEKSYAAWKAKEGRPDTRGNANHALYFQKMVPTATIAAGIAEVKGVEDTPVSDLTGLSWEHRIDGHCGAGAPRWNVVVTGATGQQYTLFLGCAAAAHTPTTDTNWIRDSYPGPTIVATGAANAGLTAAQQADVAAGTVSALYIVFDEGTDQGKGFVYLDNITVEIHGTPHIWTSPSDNGSN